LFLRKIYPYLLKDVDVGIVCLNNKNKTPFIPGKFLGYLAGSLPIVAFLNNNSDGFSLIEKAKCGYAVESNNINEAVKVIKKIYIEKEKLKESVYSKNIYGSEKSLKNSRVTRMNLWFHGDGSSNVYCLDTLDKNFNYDRSILGERKEEIEEFKKKIIDDGLKFNKIFTNPPFSTTYEFSKKDEEKILEDYDISYKELNKEKNQRVTSLKSNVMFIERYYDLLDDGGELLTVIDESVLNADQEKYFRKYILNKFILKAVISLPRNSFTNADTGTKNICPIS